MLTVKGLSFRVGQTSQKAMPFLVAPLTRFLLLAAFGVTLVGCAAGGGEGPLEYDSGGQATAAARDYPVHGIDVSKYQGDVDWNAVAGSGGKFARNKATQGGEEFQEKFPANWGERE